ncbi:RodZ domain-containing protein [Bacillus sp. MRMR6]|uniref:helix-turn-helix domain-containing protein n=1 Tax=Bacillus sp. MRMR6 TaxID=1928617 RepID=UPI0009516754|nr:RodZ domain-containing protein [Bacillus sp. MRMR6]OLS42139.1 helix-turn-helix domain-containing protein [Bacillus sp. MRMR6]
MTELGNRLKEVRLAKGLSLDDVQSITKIQKRYLIGIEEGNYSAMPGNFYVRAFVKQYAEALHLNPDEIFDTYKGEIPATHHDDLPEQLSRVKTRKSFTESSSKIFDVLPKILIGVFLIGAAGVLYYFLANNLGNNANDAVNNDNEPVKFVRSDNLDQVEEDTEEGTENGETEQAEEKDPVPVEETPKQELTVVESGGIKTTYDLKNADKFELKLVSKGESWVNIKDEAGKSYFQGMLSTAAGGTPSTTVDLTNDGNIIIVVGRTLDTDIFVNDQKLEYAIAPTEVVRQDITIQYVPKDKE